MMNVHFLSRVTFTQRLSPVVLLVIYIFKKLLNVLKRCCFYADKETEVIYEYKYI